MEGNLGYTVVAYVAAFLLIGSYTWSLRRRLARARNASGKLPAATQGVV